MLGLQRRETGEEIVALRVRLVLVLDELGQSSIGTGRNKGGGRCAARLRGSLKLRPQPRCLAVALHDDVGNNELGEGRFGGWRSECHFAGFYSRQEIGRYYASADIYIHPSLTETFGNVLTEAMASGLAVAGFDYAAARQFINHRQNGLIVPCDQPDELMAAAVELACDQHLRANLRHAARDGFEQQSWSNVIGRFEDDLIAVTKLGFSA